MRAASRRRATRYRSAQLGWLGVWLVVAAAVVLPYVRTYHHLSPFDEWVHVDYVVKAQHFELVNGGEKVGQVALREQACRKSDLAIDFPPCRSKHFDPDVFPGEGYNTAYPDPPVYYWVTAAGTAVVQQLPGVEDIVVAARSTGVVWLGFGLWLGFLLARRLGANTISAAGATLLVAATPVTGQAMATVTSDAPMLIIGAGLCLAALAVARGRLSWWWLLVATALAAGVKATSLTAIGLVLVFLLLHLALRPTLRTSTTSGPDEPDGPPAADRDLEAHELPGLRRPGQVVRVAIGVVVATLVVFGGWSAVNSLTALPGVDDQPMRDLFHVDSLTWQSIVGNLLNLFSPAQNGYLPPFMVNSGTVPVLMSLLNLLLIAGVLGVAWAGAHRTEVGRIAIATAAAMLVSGPALVVVIYAGSHTYVPIPFRYGLALLPAAAACLAWGASQRRAGGPVLLALGVLTMAALLANTL